MELSRQQSPFPHLRCGAGPAVLLVPGLGATAQFWSAQLPELAEHYTVFAWDQRGSGNRQEESPGHRLPALAAEVAQLIEAAVEGPALLVGHSMGAAVCKHVALTQPSRIRGLVLSSAWARPHAGFSALLAARRTILEQVGPEAYLLASAAMTTPPAHLEPPSFDVASLVAQARRLDIAAELSRIDALASHDLGDRVAGIRVPVELLAAEDDRLTPVEMTRELAALLPDAHLTLLSDGGHRGPQLNAAQFSEALLRALARLLASEPGTGRRATRSGAGPADQCG